MCQSNLVSSSRLCFFVSFSISEQKKRLLKFFFIKVTWIVNLRRKLVLNCKMCCFFFFLAWREPEQKKQWTKPTLHHQQNSNLLQKLPPLMWLSDSCQSRLNPGWRPESTSCPSEHWTGTCVLSTQVKRHLSSCTTTGIPSPGWWQQATSSLVEHF